jgi:large subunit ribosomal protein L11
MEQTVDVVVEGGKATAAPPLGPALGPMGVNIQQVVDTINEKTRDLDGIKVPVKVIVDTATHEFRVEVGKPPASALILKELNIEKGSALAGKDRAGDLTNGQVKKIAKAKFGSEDESSVRQIKGTCRSMGVTIGEGEVTDEERRKAEEDKLHVMEEEEAKEKAAEEKEAGVAPAEEGAEGEEAAPGKEEGKEEAAPEEKPEKPDKKDKGKEPE